MVGVKFSHSQGAPITDSILKGGNVFQDYLSRDPTSTPWGPRTPSDTVNEEKTGGESRRGRLRRRRREDAPAPRCTDLLLDVDGAHDGAHVERSRRRRGGAQRKLRPQEAYASVAGPEFTGSWTASGARA